MLHHDVYLPEGWDKLLAAQIELLERRDPNWAILGAYGIAEDGRGHGPVWSSSLGMIAGRVTPEPVRAVSLDELLIVLKLRTGLRFDEGLPDWHLYGTDIVQTARRQGFTCYAGALPCIHNDSYKPILGKGFLAGYEYLARKWHDDLPLSSPSIRVTRTRLSFMRVTYRMRRGEAHRRAMATDTSVAPEELAAMCGWRNVAPRA